MKAQELNLQPSGYVFTCKTWPARSHYKHIMKMGRALPATKAQAQYFITEGICLDVLNYDDVKCVEELMNRHGYIGEYQYTKSCTWVRLQNDSDFRNALKAEFNL